MHKFIHLSCESLVYDFYKSEKDIDIDKEKLCLLILAQKWNINKHIKTKHYFS